VGISTASKKDLLQPIDRGGCDARLEKSKSSASKKHSVVVSMPLNISATWVRSYLVALDNPLAHKKTPLDSMTIYSQALLNIHQATNQYKYSMAWSLVDDIIHFMSSCGLIGSLIIASLALHHCTWSIDAKSFTLASPSWWSITLKSVTCPSY
jgi:hypothetical protein